MTSPLEGALAKTIGKAFKTIFCDATLTVETPGSGPVYDPGEPTTTDYPCKGMVSDYSAYELQNSRIETGDRKVMVLATSLPITPASGQIMAIRGGNYRIVNVTTDPAQTVWVLQCRR